LRRNIKLKFYKIQQMINMKMIVISLFISILTIQELKINKMFKNTDINI